MPHLHVHVITIIGPDITETAVDTSEGLNNRNCITTGNNYFKARQGSVAWKKRITGMHPKYHMYLWFCLCFCENAENEAQCYFS